MPRDLKIKRLCGRLFELSQDGEYNYLRALKRTDGAAARLFLDDFVTGAVACIYLLNDKYRPYRKWLMRGLMDLPEHTEIAARLNSLLTSPAEAGAEAVSELSRYLAKAALDKYGLNDIYENDKLFYDHNLEIPFMIDLSIKLKMYNLIDKKYSNMKAMVDDIWP